MIFTVHPFLSHDATDDIEYKVEKSIVKKEHSSQKLSTSLFCNQSRWNFVLGCELLPHLRGQTLSALDIHQSPNLLYGN